ncbi:unnamed protein product [Dibothriocephalus latus]|uniref:Uncharacterized protein n=1 Tax=Dibothriocephalus latus TaxID=60516 RepID=A0A3P7LU84_DIBLA|nr:unnamed protein product [Dibothriocephalus latus]
MLSIAATFEHHPALHIPSNCHLHRLPVMLSPTKTGNASLSVCLSQPEWEIRARDVCNRNASQHLFSAYPIEPCEEAEGGGSPPEALRRFSGLDFVCCGQVKPAPSAANREALVNSSSETTPKNIKNNVTNAS